MGVSGSTKQHPHYCVKCQKGLDALSKHKTHSLGEDKAEKKGNGRSRFLIISCRFQGSHLCVCVCVCEGDG